MTPTIHTTNKSFNYKIKAVNRGEFTIPGAMGEGLYNSDVKFLGKTEGITVK